LISQERNSDYGKPFQPAATQQSKASNYFAVIAGIVPLDSQVVLFLPIQAASVPFLNRAMNKVSIKFCAAESLFQVLISKRLVKESTGISNKTNPQINILYIQGTRILGITFRSDADDTLRRHIPDGTHMP